MANRYAVAAGGNWTADATWSTTDGGAPDTVAPTASDDVFLTVNSGNVTISATSVGKSLTCTGYTGTLTHNAFTLTISGSVTLVAGMTYTSSASSNGLTINATGTLTTAGKTLNGTLNHTAGTLTLGDDLILSRNFQTAGTFVANSRKVTFTGDAASVLVGTPTFYDLTIQGSAIKTHSFVLTNNFTVTNIFEIAGNSSTNRILIRSSTLGTARTITNTGATETWSNVDFRDIAMSESVDASAITGLSGDCGGNSGITFTTAATQTYTGGTGSWSDNTKWTSRVPLPQDNVLMSGVTGGTITADMPRLGKSIDWTGAAGTPAFNLTSVSNTIYGSFTLISAMTFTTSQNPIFEGRTSGLTITSAGKLFSNDTFISAVGGTYTLQDAFSASTPATIRITNGTLNTNGVTLTVGRFLDNGSTSTRAINLSSSTINCNTTLATSAVALNSTGMTFNAGTSTFLISDTGANAKTFSGGGLAYNDIQFSGGGAGAIIFTGANTLNRLYMNPSVQGTKSITLPGSTTTTILSGQGLGNGTNVITFTASSGSATIAKSSGILEWNYVNLTNIPSSGSAQFYAGANSIDGGGNTGWGFYSATPELTDIGTSYRLPNEISLHNICLWLDGGGGTWADKVTKTFYTPTAMHQDVCIHDGKSMLFDGTASKIVCGDRSVSSTKLVKSVSFWAKPSSTAGYFIDLNGTASVGMTANAITTSGWTSPTVYVNGVAQNSIQTGVWSFVTVTSSTGLNASAVVLGLISSSYYSGALTNITLMDKIVTADNHRWMYGEVRVGVSDLMSGVLDEGNLTFFKDYDNEQDSVNADYSVGSSTGTWTVTRSASTPATYVDASGVIQIKTDTTPRFTQGFYDSTGFVSRPGIIVEGAGTNLALDSYMADGATTPYWTNFAAGGTVTNSTTYTNPYGGGNITKLVADTALQGFVNNAAYRQNITSGTVYTASVLMRGSGDVYVASGPNGGTLNYSSKITLSNSWKRYQLTFTADFTGGGILGIRLKENQSVTAYISFCQLEASPFATTFIPTTTAALTRNAETLTYPISGNRTAATESIFTKFTPYWNGTAITSNNYIMSTDTKRRIINAQATSDKLKIFSNADDSSAAAIDGTSAITAFTSYIVGATFASTGDPNQIIYSNGAFEGSNNTDFTTPAWGTNFYIGSTSIPDTHLYGIIQSLAIFSDAKSAAVVSRISTLMTNN